MRRGLLLALGLFGCASPPEGVLSVLPAPENTLASALPRGAVALALGGLPADTERHLGDEIAAATRAAIQRANPLYVDLSGEPAAGPLAAHLPALTAAANLLGSPWQGPGLRVELGADCRPEARLCIPLFRERQDDGLERRARGMVWTLSNAALLRAPGRVEAVREALQQRAIQTDSTIALVFTKSSGSFDATGLSAIQREASRALRYVPAEANGHSWLEALAQPAPQWALPIQLEPDELLVIPRLGALARVNEFVLEVRQASSAEWVVVPTQG
jgi:hypothetical protein